MIFKATKKPVTIEAICFETNNDDNSCMDMICGWINAHGTHAYHDGTSIFISTLEGEMRADCYDYIIKGVNGEFYPCKPDIFHKTYDVEGD